MFDTKFAMEAVSFQGLAQSVCAPGADPLLRTQGWLAFVADVLARFERYPQLAKVKLLAGTQAHLNRENNLDIRIEHHVRLTAEGGAQDWDDAQTHDEYVRTMLPFPVIGAGVFEFRRSDPLVQRYLALPAGETAQFVALVQELAWNVDAAFGHVFIAHELGTDRGASDSMAAIAPVR